MEKFLKFDWVTVAKIFWITILLFIIIAFSGCRIIKPTETIKESTYKEILRDTGINVKGGEVNKNLDSATIALIISKLNKGEKVVYEDKNTGVALSFYLDELGRLNAMCASKDSTYKVQIKDLERSISEKKSETVIENKVPNWVWVLIGSLCTIILISTITIIVLIKVKINATK